MFKAVRGRKVSLQHPVPCRYMRLNRHHDRSTTRHSSLRMQRPARVHKVHQATKQAAWHTLVHQQEGCHIVRLVLSQLCGHAKCAYTLYLSADLCLFASRLVLAPGRPRRKVCTHRAVWRTTNVGTCQLQGNPLLDLQTTPVPLESCLSCPLLRRRATRVGRRRPVLVHRAVSETAHPRRCTAPSLLHKMEPAW